MGEFAHPIHERLPGVKSSRTHVSSVFSASRAIVPPAKRGESLIASSPLPRTTCCLLLSFVHRLRALDRPSYSFVRMLRTMPAAGSETFGGYTISVRCGRPNYEEA